MHKSPIFGRVITAVVTPFASDGSIDFGALETLIYHIAHTKSDAVVIAGTTGEGATLSFEEKIELFKFWKEKSPQGVKLIANTGTNDTAYSIKLTQAAEKLNMDGVMAVYPYYNKPNTEGQVRHFRALANATSLPIMLYNVPSRTGGAMTLEAIIELSGTSNIVAIKEASGNLEFVSSIAKYTEGQLDIYSGDDTLTLPILSIGGVGVVSVASHIVGEQIRKMIDLFFSGDTDGARKIHLQLFGLFKALFITVNPIPIKTALSMLGMMGEHFRLPLVPASDGVKKELISIMSQHNLFPGIPGVASAEG